MLITARACQGAFAALLVPSALSLLTTTFTEPKDRARAFAIYGAIAGAGGAIGLLLGGALTEYLSWRWTLYVNLIFAGVAFTGGALLLKRQPSPVKPRLDIPGVLLVSSAVFCLVYGFSNAAAHSWAHAVHLRVPGRRRGALAVFAAWQGRAAHPLLPPRVVLDRNRGGAYLSMLIGTAGLFGIFLFLTYYLQQTLGYSPLRDRRRVPADERRPHCRGQSVHDHADAQIRAQAAGRVRDAGRRRRDGLAGPAGPAHRLYRRACSARSSWPESAWAW